MDVVVFSEGATPKSARKKAPNRSKERLSSPKSQGSSIDLIHGSVYYIYGSSKTPGRQSNNEEYHSPVYLRRSTRKRSSTSSGKANNTKRTKHRDSNGAVVSTTTYQLPQFTNDEVDWADILPPQSKFQLTRTPVKRTNEMDHESEGEVKKDINEQLTEINDQDVTSTVDPVIDDVVINNEVTIITDDQTSIQHNEAMQRSSPIIIQEDVSILPATLQCTDDDLAYLERMANIKLLKELTDKSNQLDKELKNVQQEAEEISYKCQKADEEYTSLSAANKRTAIMVHHFLNNKHIDTISEVGTEELQAAGDVTLDKKTIEQLYQAHKELKFQLQTTSRVAEKKKAMLKKQKEQNKGAMEKTASLQAEKKQLTTKLREMTQHEDELREQIASLEQQQLKESDTEEENRFFMKQLDILKERCELYKQREQNMKQISDYMDKFEQRTRQKRIYHVY